jgi:hypothetical protein
MSVFRRRWPRTGASLLAGLLACMPGHVAFAAEGVVPLVVPQPAPAPQQPAFLGDVLSQSRVVYPLQVGRWVAQEEQRYPRQQEGVSVRYIDNGKRRWIDLFFYPTSVRGDAALAVVAAAERDAIDLAARQAGRQVTLGTLELAGPEPGTPDQERQSTNAATTLPRHWRLGLRYPQESLASAMELFVRDLYVVKARASAAEPATTVTTLQSELQAFMAQVAAQLRIVNTGACWLPARTAVAATLPAADADQVLASYRDPAAGEVAAVVLRDQVLVAQAHAARAGEISTALAAELYPGCVAPEAIEPEVPPPMREIRIEYRAPAYGAPSRGPPIGRPRAPRSGTG